MAHTIDDFLEQLAELDERINTLTAEPIPSPADEMALCVALLYLDLSELEQSEARGLVSPKLGRYLLAFSGRLAILAVRRKDADMIAAAIALHAMEDFQFDLRENIRVFALIGDASRRIGVSLQDVWERVSTAFSPEHQEYAAHARNPRALQTMGMMGTVRAGEFDYVPIE